MNDRGMRLPQKSLESVRVKGWMLGAHKIRTSDLHIFAFVRAKKREKENEEKAEATNIFYAYEYVYGRLASHS